MDEASKTKAIEKVKSEIKIWIYEQKKNIFKALSIDEKIGYPEYLGSMNTTELEKMYREVWKSYFLIPIEYLLFWLIVYFWCIIY